MLRSYVPTGMKGNDDDDDEHIHSVSPPYSLCPSPPLQWNLDPSLLPSSYLSINVVFCFPGTGVMTEGLAVQGVGGYSLNKAI